jgi:hypothetical protein
MAARCKMPCHQHSPAKPARCESRMHAACLQHKSAAEGGLPTLGADQDARAVPGMRRVRCVAAVAA